MSQFVTAVVVCNKIVVICNKLAVVICNKLLLQFVIIMQPPVFFAILSQAKRYCSFDGRTFLFKPPTVGARGETVPQAQILTTICPLWLQVFQNSKMIFSKLGVANQIYVKKDKLSSLPVRLLFYKNLPLQHIVLDRVCPPQLIFSSAWSIQSCWMGFVQFLYITVWRLRRA